MAGSGLLLAGLFLAFIAALAPSEGAGAAAAPSPALAPVAAFSRSADGWLLFRTKGCAACHSLSAQGHRAYVNGPDLSGVDFAARRPGLDATAYLRESIREPGAFQIPGASDGWDMPVLGLSDAEIDALVGFLLGG